MKQDKSSKDGKINFAGTLKKGSSKVSGESPTSDFFNNMGDIQLM